jgi:hypothetical protein
MKKYDSINFQRFIMKLIFKIIPIFLITDKNIGYFDFDELTEIIDERTFFRFFVSISVSNHFSII